MTEVESRQELARVSEDIGKIDNSMLASSDYSIIVIRPTYASAKRVTSSFKMHNVRSWLCLQPRLYR
jgi:hypothetical protein